jgi:hypothetical protein
LSVLEGAGAHEGPALVDRGGIGRVERGDSASTRARCASALSRGWKARCAARELSHHLRALLETPKTIVWPTCRREERAMHELDRSS